MPRLNHFRHQQYTDAIPPDDFQLIEATFPPQLGSDSYDQQMKFFGTLIKENVDSIHLIHGTFVGKDILGWIDQIEKFWPQRAEQLRELGKRMVDSLTKDTGNFTAAYARQLQQSVPDVPVRRFHWSGENNHVARGVAALEWLDTCIQKLKTEPRILLLCHSHAGNVAALATNLLAADQEHRDQFLKTLQPIFRRSAELEQFQRVRDWLAVEELRRKLKLDIVTMGTPIRYGWDSAGYRHLLHFVNHIRQEGAPAHLSPLPELKKSVRRSAGDYPQQLGIAGTNIMPYLFDLTLQRTELKLGKFLQPFGRKDFLKHLKIGMRVPHEGTTLLVNYEDTNGLARKLAGHGVYTEKEWLAFHVGEIAKRFYGDAN